MTPSSRPPPGLVEALVGGPPAISAVEWHDEVESTNTLAATAAARGVPEIHAVLADHQRAGRGRHGRGWLAPPGTSLLLSFVVRPGPGAARLSLLPLLSGLAVAEAVEPFCGAAQVGLKWPNDVLVAGVKAAGVLLEAPIPGTVIVGIGVNVDWRQVAMPDGLAATSLAEAAGRGVDRWEVLAALAGGFARRYRAWLEAPTAFLPAYRRRSATLGQRVRVTPLSAPSFLGRAAALADDGTLVVRLDDGTHVSLSAGEVEHLRSG
jgi:BirA family transcriptional regulator, biotin operon repressor / biotin---[acetyl-CoA-carboxylase] ligase